MRSGSSKIDKSRGLDFVLDDLFLVPFWFEEGFILLFGSFIDFSFSSICSSRSSICFSLSQLKVLFALVVLLFVLFLIFFRLIVSLLIQFGLIF
jgi:hypothetical protein